MVKVEIRMKKILIKKGRLIDPVQKIDSERVIYLEDGFVKGIYKPGEEPPVKGEVYEINLDGELVIPGLIDLHTHLREPGEEWKEDIESGTSAAAKGGFTTVVAMPNTIPPNDNAEVTTYVIQRAKEKGKVNVLPAGKIKRKTEGKIQITPMGEMVKAGAVCFTDDGLWVENARLMERALEYSKFLGVPVLSHPEELSLSKDGQINEGKISLITGLKGIPAQSEEIAVFRDIKLAELTGARLHLQHISTKGAVEIIKWAKEKGLANVTCEITPHHFSLTEDALVSFDTNAKVKPPLRTEEDKMAILKAIYEGLIDCIATDHAPHSQIEKDVEFTNATFGISGLETALSLSLNLVKKGIIDYFKLVELLSLNPAKIINFYRGTLKSGEVADITIVDPDREWTVSEKNLLSKGKNTPFLGKTLKGVVLYTIVSGEIVYSGNKNG